MADKDGKDKVELDTSAIQGVIDKLESIYDKGSRAYSKALQNLPESLPYELQTALIMQYKMNETGPEPVWQQFQIKHLNTQNTFADGMPVSNSMIQTGFSNALGSSKNPTTQITPRESVHQSPTHGGSTSSIGTNTVSGFAGRQMTPSTSTPVSSMSGVVNAITKQTGNEEEQTRRGDSSNENLTLRQQLGDIALRLGQQTDILGDIRGSLETMNSHGAKLGGFGEGGKTTNTEDGSEKEQGGGIGAMLGGAAAGVVGGTVARVIAPFVAGLFTTAIATAIGLLKGPETFGMIAGMGAFAQEGARNLRPNIQTATENTGTYQRVRAYNEVNAAHNASQTDEEFQAHMEDLGKKYDSKTLGGAQEAVFRGKPLGNLNWGDKVFGAFSRMINKNVLPTDLTLEGFGIHSYAAGGAGNYPFDHIFRKRHDTTQGYNLNQQADDASARGDHETAKRLRNESRQAYREAYSDVAGQGARTAGGVDAIYHGEKILGSIGKGLSTAGLLAGGYIIGKDVVAGVNDFDHGDMGRATTDFVRAGASTAEYVAGGALFKSMPRGNALRDMLGTRAGLGSIARKGGILSVVAGAGTLISDVAERHQIETDPHMTAAQKEVALANNSRGMGGDAAGAVGSAIGGTIGATLGALVPIPGLDIATALGGGALGGMLGDKAGRMIAGAIQGPPSAESAASKSLDHVGSLTANASNVYINGRNVDTAHTEKMQSLVNNGTKDSSVPVPHQTNITMNNNFNSNASPAEITARMRALINEQKQQDRALLVNQQTHSTTGNNK